MKSKIFRTFDILVGIVIASLFFLTVRSIVYIYIYDHQLGDSLYEFIFGLLSFGIICFLWVKSKKSLFKVVIILILIGTYFLGRMYAIKEYKSFKDAQTIFAVANSDEGYAWAKETDKIKYMEGVRIYVSKLKLASDTIRPSLRWGKTYYESYYLLKKDLLNYDEKITSGEVSLTQDEINKIVDESNNKIKTLDQQGYMLPFWTDFFLVK